MSRIGEIDSIVRASLESLARELKVGEWKGRREREVVSLFCFGHLIEHCRPNTVLHDRTQIAIEVAVPQIDGQRQLTGKVGKKSQVCKDIVIWPRPRMVAWDDSGLATVPPSSVIEWKHNEANVSTDNVNWLRQFSARHRGFVGYAVCTKLPAREFALSCTRVVAGKAEKWLRIT
jgi:hypothetical protein